MPPVDLNKKPENIIACSGKLSSNARQKDKKVND